MRPRFPDFQILGQTDTESLVVLAINSNLIATMEDLGRFAIAKDVFSSKGKVSNRKVMDSVGLQVRRQAGVCKELQIVQGTSNLREVYLTNDMKLEEFNQDDGFLVMYSPLYSTRLTILGPIPQLQRLHDCIFKVDTNTSTASTSRQFGAKIVLPKNEIHCPLRSEILSCPSAASPPDLKRKTSLSSALKPQQSNLLGVSNRAYKSGFSPPSKKSNCKSSPPHNNSHANTNTNKENVPNRNTSNNNAATSVSESFGSCAKNLTSMLDMQVEEDLTEEQILVLDAITRGENVFYTGSAGTGKSTLLKRIIDMTRSKFGSENVHVTATTGLAACALGGATLHMTFNLPAIDESSFTPVARKQLIDIVSEKRIVQNRIRNMKVLIIDEVSMLGPRLLEVIDELCRKVRACDMPLGGIQCICTGDFFQLPPVIINRPINNNNMMLVDDNASQGSGGSFISHHSSSQQQQAQTQRAQQQLVQQQRYCFESSVWPRLFPPQQCFELRKIYRQQEDTPFASVLDEVRLGHPSMSTLSMLNSRVNAKLHAIHGVVPTMLFTHRKEVEQVNTSRLRDLSGQLMTFNAQDTGESSFIPLLQRSCPARATLELKIGAQVILLKSTQQSVGLVNGARAVIVRFQRDTRMPVVKLAQGGEFLITPEIFSLCIGGRSVAQRRQLPLDLAWAVSIHKAQGMTVDQAEVNLRGAFEFGQAYVALSRVRSLQGLCLKGPLLPAQIKADPRVEEFYRLMRQHRTAATTSANGRR